MKQLSLFDDLDLTMPGLVLEIDTEFDHDREDELNDWFRCPGCGKANVKAWNRHCPDCFVRLKWTDHADKKREQA